jgi:hypothetical protein
VFIDFDYNNLEFFDNFLSCTVKIILLSYFESLLDLDLDLDLDIDFDTDLDPD